MPCAARLGDQIVHSQALPQAKSGWWGGLLKGALVGAAIVAVTAVAIVATVGTGGLGAPFAIGAAAVVIGSALRYAQVGFHEGAQQAASMPGVRAGPITVGSANVFINGNAAALACLSLAACTQHGDGKQVAQGSRTVTLNGHQMARVGDGGVCGFVIGEGSPNVFVGAPPVSCHGLAVGSEIPQELVDAVDTAGKVGGYMELVGGILMGGPSLLNAFKSVAGVVTVGGGLLAGWGGSRLASDWAKQHGMSASNQMMLGDFGGLGGSLLGGGMISKGIGMFGGAPVVETPVETPLETPVEPQVETPSLVDRSQLNPEDVFPGQQSDANCAPQSCQQIVRVATGNNISEADMAASAQTAADYQPGVGTPANRVPDILEANGVPADTMPNTPESIQAALDQGRGVVSSHNAEDLWPGDPNFVDDPNNPVSGGHAVHTIDTVRDADGNVTGYVINDTGTGTAGRIVSADQYEGSLMDGVPATATDNPIYTPYQPVEAPPESLGGVGTGEGDATTGTVGSSGGSSSSGGGTGSTVPMVDGNPVPAGVSPARYEGLGRDPATGGTFRVNEADTALRVEAQEGVTLQRYTPPPGQKGDWIDPATGNVYDGCSPTKAPYFEQQMNNGGYNKSLLKHVDNPSVDRVVVDTHDLALTPAEEARLDATLSSLTPAQQAKIVRVK